MTEQDEMRALYHFVGGERVHPRTDRTYEVIDPCGEEAYAESPSSGGVGERRAARPGGLGVNA